MRYDPAILDEIRARLPVSQVVSRRVKLKRQGREYIGLSPFKQEKTPSFTVNDQKGFYHCFSSGEHGDIFDFVMKTEGLSFPEAVSRLAEEAGVTLPTPSTGDKERQNHRQRLQAAMAAAAQFFQEALQGEAGGIARRYLAERGVSPNARAQFQLGYAPNSRRALKDHLAALGFTEAEMAEAGLIVSGPDIPVSYDRFRDRLIFPICDLGGRVIAFGARALRADQQAKYLNSPETPLFHKGRVLYNAHRARKAAFERESVIAVEGYMDVIGLAEAGFPHVVAPLGTALTPEQLRLLWRLAPEPILCFDGDAAGQRAAARAVATALPLLQPGFSLRFAFLPEGDDPDDLVRREGPGAMTAVLDQARPLVDVFWENETQKGDWQTPERRAALESRVMTALSQIAHDRIRAHYQHEMRQRLAQLWQVPGNQKGQGFPYSRGRGQRSQFSGRLPKWDQGGRGLPQHHHWAPPSSQLRKTLAKRHPRRPTSVRESLLLILLLRHPWLLEEREEEVASLTFSDPRLSQLHQVLLAAQALFPEGPLDSSALRDHLKKHGLGEIVERLEQVAVHGPFACEEALGEPAEVLRLWEHLLGMHRRLEVLTRDLVEAEQTFQKEKTPEALRRVEAIIRQIQQLEMSLRPDPPQSERTQDFLADFLDGE